MQFIVQQDPRRQGCNMEDASGWVAVRLSEEEESYFPRLFEHIWKVDNGKIVDTDPIFPEDRGNVYFPAIKTNPPAEDMGEYFANDKMAMLYAREEGERFLHGGTLNEIFDIQHNPKIKVIEEMDRDTEGPYWGGHVWVEKWKVPSESSDKVYTVSRDTEGRWGCSCPAWIYRRLVCKHIRQMKAQHNPPVGRWHKPTKVQSVVFKKGQWTIEQAKDWLHKHGFKYGDVDEKPNEIRFRQFSPENFRKGHFRSMPFGKGRGIRAIIAEPNPKTNKKALITWIPQTKKYRVVIIDEKGERSKYLFKNDDALVEGLWNIWPGFFQNKDKKQDFCPLTTEWVAPPRRNPQNPNWGPLNLEYDIPPTKSAPTRRFLHKCPPMEGEARRTDEKGIQMLNECVGRLQQTKNLHREKKSMGRGRKPVVVYTPDRLALHNEIISHIFDGVECIGEGQRPIAILTGGPPGAGKTTYMQKNIPWTDKEKTKGLLHIDADYIRGMLPEYEGWNAGATHEETRDVLKKVLGRIGTPCKTDILYDGTMQNESKYRELIHTLREMGYFIYIVYVRLPRKDSAERVKNRYAGKGGRYVPEFVVKEANLFARRTFNKLALLADGYIEVDGRTGKDWEVLGKKGELPETRPYWRETKEATQ
jgi:predicted ABC-type ATPase